MGKNPHPNVMWVSDQRDLIVVTTPQGVQKGVVKMFEESKSSIVYHLREALKHCYNLPKISHLTYEEKEDGREIVEFMFKNRDVKEIDVTNMHGIDVLLHVVLSIKNCADGLW